MILPKTMAASPLQRIIISVELYYGNVLKWYQSKNNGKSWTHMPENDSKQTLEFTAELKQNGRLLWAEMIDEFGQKFYTNPIRLLIQ